MVKQWTVTVPSPKGEDTRRAYIYLPDSYFEEERTYPVLYMFDGQNIFFDEDATYGKSWGLEKYLDETGTQLIVVGVECNGSADNGRLSEYSPFNFRDRQWGSFKGFGAVTMDWFAYELKPYIDSSYRTVADREGTFIAGSSMGGLMSLFAVCAYNHVYGRAAALSPSVWVSPTKLYKMIRESDIADGTVLYMDYGSREAEFRPGLINSFAKAAALLIDRGVFIDCRIVPNGTHTEGSWEQQLPFMMATLLYGWD